MLSADELERYQRHIILPELGRDGQERLKRARVLVVGAGGLGAPVLLYLGSAGVGTIGIVDDDYVSKSNLQRQVIFDSSDVGKLKAEVAARVLKEKNPHVTITIYAQRLNAENIENLFSSYDLIIDGSDNFATRYLVNDACVVLDKPFVSGAIFRFEGQVSVFNLKDSSGKHGPTYRCLYPEPPDPGSVPSCSEIGVLGVLPAVIGSLQATEAVKVITGIGTPLAGRILLYDALKMQITFLQVSRNENSIKHIRILSNHEYQAVSCQDTSQQVRELSARELKAALDAGEQITLIDVREPFEKNICDIGGELIRMSALVAQTERIPRKGKVVVYCRSGVRSHRAIALLQQKSHFANLFNLRDGILGWISEVDPSLTPY